MFSTNESLFVFRDMANQMFRLAMTARDGDSQKAMVYYDEGLTTILKVLEAKEVEQKMSTALSSEIGNTITNAYLARDTFEPISVPDMNKNPEPPTLVIHHDVSPHVVVTKEDSSVKMIQLSPINEVMRSMDLSGAHAIRSCMDMTSLRIPSTGSDADDECESVEVEEEEEVEEVEEEVEEVEEEVEEEELEEEEVEEEEEESMEVIKIGKKKYYCGETSRQIFVYLNDEESGDCLGKYVDGKIVSLK